MTTETDAGMTGGRMIGGWIVSSALAEMGSAIVAGADFPNPVIGTLVVVLVEAVLLALLQALLLRSVGRGLAARWVVATLVGTLVGRVLQGAAPTFAPVVLVGATAGLVMAAPQALVLRRYVARAWAWLAVRTVAWGLAMPLLVFGGDALASDSGLPLPAAMAGILSLFGLIGAFVGTLEGVCIARLLAHRRRDDRRSSLEAAASS